MLKKLLTGVLAAGAMAVPLAAVAWADPMPSPNPPGGPVANDQGPGNPANPAAPAVPSSYGQGPICVVGANPPAPGTSIQGATAQGTPAEVAPGATWQQVATLQGPAASNLGVPAGQPMNVFCAPTGSQNPQGQPIGYPPGLPIPGQTNPGQAPAQNPQSEPAGYQPGQTNPGQAPAQNAPGQTGPQNPVPGQQ
jgi:hypothetical protein